MIGIPASLRRVSRSTHYLGDIMYDQLQNDATHIAGITNELGITHGVLELHRITQARNLGTSEVKALSDKAASLIRDKTPIQAS